MSAPITCPLCEASSFEEARTRCKGQCAPKHPADQAETDEHPAFAARRVIVALDQIEQETPSLRSNPEWRFIREKARRMGEKATRLRVGEAE